MSRHQGPKDWIADNKGKYTKTLETVVNGLLRTETNAAIPNNEKMAVDQICLALISSRVAARPDINLLPWADAYRQDEETLMCLDAAYLLKTIEIHNVEAAFKRLQDHFAQKIKAERYQSLFILYNAYIEILCTHQRYTEAVKIFKTYYGDATQFRKNPDASDTEYDLHGLTYFPAVIATIAIAIHHYSSSKTFATLNFIVGQHGEDIVKNAVVDSVAAMAGTPFSSESGGVISITESMIASNMRKFITKQRKRYLQELSENEITERNNIECEEILALEKKFRETIMVESIQLEPIQFAETTKRKIILENYVGFFRGIKNKFTQQTLLMSSEDDARQDIIDEQDTDHYRELIFQFDTFQRLLLPMDEKKIRYEIEVDNVNERLALYSDFLLPVYQMIFSDSRKKMKGLFSSNVPQPKLPRAPMNAATTNPLWKQTVTQAKAPKTKPPKKPKQNLNLYLKTAVVFFALCVIYYLCWGSKKELSLCHDQENHLKDSLKKISQDISRELKSYRAAEKLIVESGSLIMRDNPNHLRVALVYLDVMMNASHNIMKKLSIVCGLSKEERDLTFEHANKGINEFSEMMNKHHNFVRVLQNSAITLQKKIVGTILSVTEKASAVLKDSVTSDFLPKLEALVERVKNLQLLLDNLSQSNLTKDWAQLIEIEAASKKLDGEAVDIHNRILAQCTQSHPSMQANPSF